MVIKKIDYLNLSMVGIFDPIEIDNVSVDSLKNKCSLDFVSYVVKEALLLGSAEKKIKVTLQSNRFEFIDENRVPFDQRDFSCLKDILPNLTATLSIKAFGINLLQNIVIDGVTDAGKFIADNFLKNKTEIEKKVGKPLFSHSIRILLGEAKEYFDLKLHPVKLQAEQMGIHFHYHNDINIVDIEKLIQKIDEKRKTTIEELPKILNKVIEV